MKNIHSSVLIHALLAIIAGCLTLAPTLARAVPTGINEAHFRGSNEVVLATKGDLKATEADVFLFAVLTNAVPPAVVMNWRTLEPAQKETLRTAIDLYFQTVVGASFVSQDREPRATELDFANRVTRLMAGPAAQLLWADKTVRLTIRLFPEDVLHRYITMTQQGADDDVVTILRLVIPHPIEANLATRNDAAARAQQLRDRAVISGGLQALIDADPSLRPEGVTGPEVVLRRDGGFDTQVRAEAFRLGVSQVSNVIRTPTGAVLIEVLERGRRDVTPLAELRPTIERNLARDFLPQQYNYMLAKLRRDYYPTNRGHLYQFMPGDADIMRVDRFAITLDEFKRMYPEVAPLNGLFNRWAVVGLINQMIDHEIVWREVERAGMGRDPFLRAAEQLAGKLFLTSDWIRTRRTTIEVPDEEVLAFLPEWIEENQPGLQKTVWRLQIDGPEPFPGQEESERDAQRLLMARYLSNMTETARDQLRDRAEVAGPIVFRNPSQVIDNITPPRDERYVISFINIGATDRRLATSTIEAPWEELIVGEFTTPRTTSATSMASYYTSEQVDTATLEPEIYLPEARAALVEKLALEPMRRDYKEALERNAIVFHELIAP